VTCGAIMAQKQGMGQRVTSQNKNGDPKAAIF
jgi:hypothetical protein